MNISAQGVELIQYYESCRLRAYPDPKTGGHPWTCGWGATGPGIDQLTCWSQQQADARLLDDLASRVSDAEQAIKVPMTQGQFDGFVSILFNVGHGSPIKDGIIRLKSGYPSTLLRELNGCQYEAARAQFVRWCSPGTSVTNGLKKRRRAEQALWDGLPAAAAIVIGESE